MNFEDDDYEYEPEWLEVGEVRDAFINGQRIDVAALHVSVPGKFIGTEALIADVPRRTDGLFGRWSPTEGVRPPEERDPTPQEEFNMQCCNDPKPRISQASGRLFCGSCKRYLDQAPKEENDGDAGTEARDAGPRDGANDR